MVDDFIKKMIESEDGIELNRSISMLKAPVRRGVLATSEVKARLCLAQVRRLVFSTT